MTDTALYKPNFDGTANLHDAKRYEIRAKHKYNGIEHVLGWGDRNDAFLKKTWGQFGWFEPNFYSRVVVDLWAQGDGNLRLPKASSIEPGDRFSDVAVEVDQEASDGHA